MKAEPSLNYLLGIPEDIELAKTFLKAVRECDQERGISAWDMHKLYPTPGVMWWATIAGKLTQRGLVTSFWRPFPQGGDAFLQVGAYRLAKARE